MKCLELKHADHPGPRRYLDYGTGGPDAGYRPVTTQVAAWLVAQGLGEGEAFIVRTFPGPDHNEAAWRARLDEPLTFLLQH